MSNNQQSHFQILPSQPVSIPRSQRLSTVLAIELILTVMALRKTTNLCYDCFCQPLQPVTLLWQTRVCISFFS
jgi:hypothetical protein